MEIGDRVKYIHNQGNVPEGQTGIITKIEGDSATVRWDNFEGQGHEGNGDPTHSSWNVGTYCLQVIEPATPADTKTFQFKQEKVEPRYLENYLKHQTEKSWIYVMHIKSRQKGKILVFLKKEIPA